MAFTKCSISPSPSDIFKEGRGRSLLLDPGTRLLNSLPIPRIDTYRESWPPPLLMLTTKTYMHASGSLVSRPSLCFGSPIYLFPQPCSNIVLKVLSLSRLVSHLPRLVADWVTALAQTAWNAALKLAARQGGREKKGPDVEDGR